MNVLTNNLFTVSEGNDSARLSLPALLARLLSGPDITAFPRLAADQRGHWWRFMVRCAARALRTMDVTVAEAAEISFERLEAALREGLLEHSIRSDWALHQPESELAGFLQPPTPSGRAPDQDGYKLNTCALLTAIIGTKEHERKSETNRVLDPESLVYALVEYQGGVIFGGRGSYSTQLTGSRAGAGSGTPFVGARIGGSRVKTFRHDVEVLLSRWDATARELQGDIWALWTEPWDGERALPAKDLDPAFIPLARLVRMGVPDPSGNFYAVWFRSSDGDRVDDHTLGGRLGDPFTPLVPDPKGGHLKVRGTLNSGYGYKEVVRLLFPGSENQTVPSPSIEAALALKREDGPVEAIFEGMAFEQGKTRGFHRRVVRLPASVGFLETRERIDTAHTIMLDAVAASKTTLRSALSIYLSGKARVRDDDRAKLIPIINRLEARVDRVYFDHLFAAADSAAQDPTLEFRQWLRDWITNDLFPDAIRSLPGVTVSRREREIEAGFYLRGRLKRQLDLDEVRREERALV